MSEKRAGDIIFLVLATSYSNGVGRINLCLNRHLVNKNMSVDKFTPKFISTTQAQEAWHALEAEEILHQFDTLTEQGLTTEEARHRLETYGPNAAERSASHHILANAGGAIQ